jgi:PTS system ascorbate-specific IIA component
MVGLIEDESIVDKLLEAESKEDLDAIVESLKSKVV